MDKEIDSFLHNTENAPGINIVTLHYPPVELKLPVSFVRMLLIYGKDYVEYYHDSHMIQIESDSDSTSPELESDYDSNSD